MTGEIEPTVGIFWLLGDKLIFDTTPLSGAEQYGDTRGHRKSHIDYWTEQQRLGRLPRDVEYEVPPRGRVVFQMKTQRFALYADRCILKRKSAVSRIMKTMGLPTRQTDVGTDGHSGHYKCSKCLKGSENSDDLPSEPTEPEQPMLGIFWLYKGRLILHASPINQAEHVGDFLGYPGSHRNYWTALQERGKIPLTIDYEEQPRGRVAFNKKTKRFELYADRCILDNKLVVKKIMNELRLPATLTDTSTDGAWGEYICSRCARKIRARLDDL